MTSPEPVSRGVPGVPPDRSAVWRQHERATLAQARVRQDVAAGRLPDSDDVVRMLACACAECSLDELVAVFAAVMSKVDGR